MNSRPLDIAVVIEHANRRGGQERVALNLLSRWAGRHRVTLYCYEASAEDVPEEVEVVQLSPRPRGKLLGAMLFPWVASRAIKGTHDIVLAHGGNCLSPNFSLFHTCHPLRRQTMALVARERGRRLSLRERLNMLVRRALFERLEKRTLQRCPGRCFAVSARLARDLERAHGLPEGSVNVAPNGVDHQVFNPGTQRWRSEVRGELGLDDGALVALFIGGIWWEKGLHIALEALERTSAPWHLIVAGQDDDADSFLRLVADLGLAERVHFVGRTDRPQRLYGAADCLVLPSRFEGFPLVSLEAAACGLPVLISREGHPGDLIDADTGFVLPREPAAFAAALDELATAPERRRRMGARAAQRALEYTWDRQAAVLEKAFTQFVEDN